MVSSLVVTAIAICDITDSGLVKDDHVGVSIKKHCNGYYEFTQHALIDAIINYVNIGPSQYPRSLPACYSHTRTHQPSKTVTPTLVTAQSLASLIT
jgi:hypothetical protein